MKYKIEKSKEFYLGDMNLERLFVAEYLAKAPGDYVKVYVFTKMYAEAAMEIDDKKVASQLGIDEKNLIAAWDYWEEQGVIKKKYANSEGKYDFIVEFKSLKEEMFGFANGDDYIDSASAQVEPEGINAFGNQAVKELFLFAENILGKTLSSNTMESILYLIQERKAQPDMIAFAIDYCVGKGKTNMRYIEKVIENWLDKCIFTREEALEYLEENDNKYYKYKSIMKSLGFNRQPSSFEIKMMNTWFDELGFSVEKVLDACAKTTGIREPNFNYVDKILHNWKDEEEGRLRKTAKNGTAVDEERKAISQGVLNKYLEHLRDQAQQEAKARKLKVYSLIPELETIEKEIQKSYRNKITKGFRISKEEKEELDNNIEKLKLERGSLLMGAGFGEDYLQVKYKCDICGDTCETPEGVCSCKVQRLLEAEQWSYDRRKREV